MYDVCLCVYHVYSVSIIDILLTSLNLENR